MPTKSETGREVWHHVIGWIPSKDLKQGMVMKRSCIGHNTIRVLLDGYAWSEEAEAQAQLDMDIAEVML